MKHFIFFFEYDAQMTIITSWIRTYDFFCFFLCGGGGGGYKTYFTEIKSYCEKPQGSTPKLSPLFANQFIIFHGGGPYANLF